MVHPSTGFMMSRMLGAAPTVADAIIDQLSRPADKATNAGGWKGACVLRGCWLIHMHQG